MMRLRLLLLFFGFLSTFSGVHAEDICYFSNPKEYRSCKEDLKSKLIIKHPVDFYSQNLRDNLYVIDEGDYILNLSQLGRVYKTLYLKTSEEKNLLVTIGEQSVGAWGTGIRRPFISRKDFVIKKIDFLSWEAKSIGFQRYFDITYIDNSGIIKVLKFKTIGMPQPELYLYLDSVFQNISGKLNGELTNSKEVKNLQLNKLSELKKRRDILRSIIRYQDDNTERCIKIKSKKFPKLSNEYLELEKNISILEIELGIQEKSSSPSICNAS